MTTTYIPAIETSLILSGLGLADRRTLADLLAFLRDESAGKQIMDLLADWKDSATALVTQEQKEEINRFQDRLNTSAEDIVASEASDEELRLLLWILLRNAYELPAEITFSHRGADKITRDLGACMAETFYENADTGWQSALPNLLRSALGNTARRGMFSQMVEDYALAQISSLIEESAVRSEEEREALLEDIWQTMSSADGAIQAGEASDAGRQALTRALSTSGSIASLAAAVEAAGFSAYILAAKASAIIPFVGGKTLVSLLAVMVNPLVVIPAVFLGLKWAKTSSDRNMMTSFGSIAGATLGMIGLRAPRQGIAVMLRVFQGADGHLKKLRKQRGSMAGAIKPYRKRLEELAESIPESTDQFSTSAFDQTLFAIGKQERPAIRFIEGLLREEREAVVLTALSVGDMVYHVSMIDPQVVAAADFSSAQSVDGPIEMAFFADRMREASGRSLTGHEERLKGYVAEETVTHRLIEEGYVVERPESATQPGYDLIVDGQPMQVKCRDDVAGLRKHFEDNPDIPVIANAELQSKVANSDAQWADQVYFVEGFSDEYVTEVTQETLDAGEELLDHDVPLLAVSMAAARNLLGWWKGQISSDELVWMTATDAAGKGALSMIGGFTSASVGLLLLGPAGAVICGPAGGIFGAGRYSAFKSWSGQLVDSEADSQLKGASKELAAKCIAILDVKRRTILDLQRQLGVGPAGRHARQRMDDDLQFIAERQCDLCRFKGEYGMSGRELRDSILAATLRSNVHSSRIQKEVKALQLAYERLGSALGRKTGEGAEKAISWLSKQSGVVASTVSRKLAEKTRKPK